MAADQVIGKLNRDVKQGEVVRLSYFSDSDLIMGIVRTVEEEQRRIHKHILKRKLENQEKLILASRVSIIE